MTPGWKSSECWMLAISKVLSALIALGVIGTARADDLSGNASKAVAAVFAIVSILGAAKHYATGRNDLKLRYLGLFDSGRESLRKGLQRVGDLGGGSGTLPGLAVLCVLLLGAPAPAQCPGGVCPPQPYYQSPFARQPAQADVPADVVAASVRVAYVTARGTFGGSGTIIGIDPDRRVGWVVTNRHVVPDGAGIVWVYAAGGNSYGRYLGSHPAADLTLLEIKATDATPFVPLAGATPEPGAAVWQVGYPHGQGPVRRGGRLAAKFQGIVAGKFRDCTLSFPVVSGDSGSGVFTADKKLCGVVWGSDGRTASCVPVEYVWQLCAGCNVQIGLLNINRPRQPYYRPAFPPRQDQPIVQAPPAAPPAPDPAPAYPAPADNGQQLTALAAAVDAQGKTLANLAAVVSNMKPVPGPVGPPGRDGAPGPQGPPGPAGGAADNSAMLSALQSQLAQAGFTLEILDDAGRVVQTQEVRLGGKLRLRLEPVPQK